MSAGVSANILGQLALLQPNSTVILLVLKKHSLDYYHCIIRLYHCLPLLDKRSLTEINYRMAQTYYGNFKHEKFTLATKFFCSLGQKYSIDQKIFKIGPCLGLVQSFST